ncbi:MAG: rhodanese-like domain-containing protein [Deltaproteobacteria bacterium]|jgi:rhodanese-related sulfurtransferase|nr:rhodanese-like domain-containing protein [Deltaproteobacteria bacterium]
MTVIYQKITAVWPKVSFLAKPITIILALSLLSAATNYLFSGTPRNSSYSAKNIDSKIRYFDDFSLFEAISAEAQTIILDARDPRLFAFGHIPGAVSFPATEASTRAEIFLKSVEPGSIIITYCSEKFCPLAETLAQALIEHGAGPIWVFTPGFDRWQESGRAVSYPNTDSHSTDNPKANNPNTDNPNTDNQNTDNPNIDNK